MKDVFKVFIIVFSFSFLTGLIIYIVNSIRYNAASQQEVAARYVNGPNIFESVGFSLIFISFSYFVFRIISYLIRKFNVWLMGLVVLMINISIIYSFGSLATDMFTFKIFFNVLLTWGINFFIPFADEFIDNKLHKTIP